jgi:hypothetical protein
MRERRAVTPLVRRAGPDPDCAQKEENTMAEPVYLARATLTQKGPLHRHARLALDATADFGVHGAICEMFRLSPPRALPLPVDYIVAATGG